MKERSRLVYTSAPRKEVEQSDRRAEGRPVPPEKQRITVGIDKRRRRGKSVTVALGFRLEPEALEQLARELKQSCAAGGSAKGDEIEIQGEHVERVVALLTARGFSVR
jgi:translation initiation factor 1